MRTFVVLAACALYRAAVAEKVGLLFGSFGDVESCECLPSFFKNSLQRLVGYEIPVPGWSKPFTADMIWGFSHKQVMSQYKQIDPQCNTTFMTRARQQAVATRDVVQKLRPSSEIHAYTGFNFVHGDGCPAGNLVIDQVRRARQDGMNKLLVINQNGAQSSNSSIGISYGDIQGYFSSSEGLDWQDVAVIGINDYSQTPAYEKLLIEHTEQALNSPSNPFAGATPSDVCIVFACHGNPKSLSKSGDPYESMLYANYAKLREYFVKLGYANVSIAFQNHGGKGQPFPNSLFPWDAPPDTDVIPAISKAPCPNVLITGIISFVLDMDETQFDERIDDVRMLSSKKVYVPNVFNSQPSFVQYLASVIDGAIDGHGDVRTLHPPGAPLQISTIV